VEGYLLDTNILSVLMMPQHPKYAAVQNAVGSLDVSAPKYVSVIAIGELTFGQRLISVFTGQSPKVLAEKIKRAQTYPLLDVTKHTAAEYGELKTILAKVHFASLQDKRPRWLENWVDKVTGQVLQVDENDLWMCAQARERNLVFVTTDAKMDRVSKADSTVRLQFV